MFKTYYYLTKPGIIYGNLLTTAAGFFLASRTSIDLVIFLAVMSGTACIIASACVCNNYMDREIDGLMERTKKRALVTGKISVMNAALFALVLGVLGVTILYRFTNVLTLVVGIIGFVDYVLLYGVSKRHSVHGTVIGGISGATPIVAGYTAVSNSFDTGAFILFLILMFWQMPHFYAIAIYRLKDYAAAGLPIFSVMKGVPLTKKHILFYLVGFVITSLLLPIFGFVGIIYTVVMVALNAYWLQICFQGFDDGDSDKWARRMFGTSLICLTVFSVLLFGTAFLP